ncbi:MAG: hypothetical protein JO307_19865 [Bryobacterales bacterium]|nr:hypothetical protein [Bryobacterales bacterium]MBV9401435.1 hypothetical protein [Bryobacterales bacterium]
MANGLFEARPQPRINLQPIAGPSVLGMFGLAGATFMVAAHLCEWYGDATSPVFLFPFAAMFGGIAQFLAGMWAFKARDAVAVAVHGMWGSFWIAYGLLTIAMSVWRIPIPQGRWPEIGYWFSVLAAITWVCVAAAAAENKGVVTALALLALGSTAAAFGAFVGAHWLMVLTGYLFVAASIAAFYTGGAVMLNEAFGREIWRLGKARSASAAISVGVGEPGVVRGQA